MVVGRCRAGGLGRGWRGAGGGADPAGWWDCPRRGAGWAGGAGLRARVGVGWGPDVGGAGGRGLPGRGAGRRAGEAGGGPGLGLGRPVAGGANGMPGALGRCRRARGVPGVGPAGCAGAGPAGRGDRVGGFFAGLGGRAGGPSVAYARM